jgi:uncharacterized protein YkwD
MADPFRLEVEDFIHRKGFGVSEGHSFASDGAVIYPLANEIGVTATYFSGASGKYNVKIHYFDESDGASGVLFDIAGDSELFYMNAASTGSVPSAATAAWRMTHQSIDIEAGDVLTLFAQASGQEYAAIDYIEFIPVDPTPDPAPTPAPTPTPVPTPPPPPSSSGDTPTTLDAFEQQVLELTNSIRAEAGLPALRSAPPLSAAADKHSQDMAANDYFSHVQPDGDTLGDRARDEGYSYSRLGENIAAGYRTPEDVVAGWMNSSGHRANILNAEFEEIGIGYHQDPGADRYTHYWTQVFGTELEVA